MGSPHLRSRKYARLEVLGVTERALGWPHLLVVPQRGEGHAERIQSGLRGASGFVVGKGVLHSLLEARGEPLRASQSVQPGPECLSSSALGAEAAGPAEC